MLLKIKETEEKESEEGRKPEPLRVGWLLNHTFCHPYFFLYFLLFKYSFQPYF